MRSGWTRRSYAIFRAAFGVYLLVHFLHLLPWGGELFSDAGVVPDGGISPLLRLFPNVLALNDSAPTVAALIGAGALAGVCFALGWGDRIAAVVMWYVLTCLFGRNPLIANPSLPCVGVVLLAHAILPSVGPIRRALSGAGAGEWCMHPGLFAVVWGLMAIGYTYSGVTKLNSPSWSDGSALRAVLENPLARPGVLRDLVLEMPDIVLALATWGGLALEVLFAPLALFRRIRPWIWTMMVAMHVSLIALIDFADLSLGMLMLHAFTLDPDWLRWTRGRAGEGGAGPRRWRSLLRRPCARSFSRSRGRPLSSESCSGYGEGAAAWRLRNGVSTCAPTWPSGRPSEEEVAGQDV